ncbi:hypothetical protein EJB05_27368, partial [Eragrostis curvula]
MTKFLGIRVVWDRASPSPSVSIHASIFRLEGKNSNVMNKIAILNMSDLECVEAVTPQTN